MHSYSVLLSLDGLDADLATCRAWVDSGAQGLDGEVEVLLQSDGHQWRGDFELSEVEDVAYYRVGIVAPLRTIWSFTICSDLSSPDCVVFLSDTDRVVQPKTWLLGSWNPGYSATPLVQVMSPCARAARTCIRATTLFAERAVGARCLRLASSVPRAGR